MSNHSLSKQSRPPLPTPSTPLLTQWSPPVSSLPAQASATTTPLSPVSFTFATANSSVTWTSGAYASSTRTVTSSRTVTSARASVIPPLLPALFILVTAPISPVPASLSSTLTVVTVYAATRTALPSPCLRATFALLTMWVLPAATLVVAREALLLLVTGRNTREYSWTSFLRTPLWVCGMKFLTFFDVSSVMNIAIQILALTLRGCYFSLRAWCQFACSSLSWGRSDAAGWHSVGNTTSSFQQVRLRGLRFFFALVDCIHFLAQKIVQ